MKGVYNITFRIITTAAWDIEVCNEAAHGRHLEVLRWAREHHCPWEGPLPPSPPSPPTLYSSSSSSYTLPRV